MLVRDFRPAVTARSTARGVHARARSLLALAVVLSALLPVLLAPASRTVSAHHTGIVLPFAAGAEWVVSQGYNTSPAEGWSHYDCNPRTGKDDVSRSTRCDPGWQYKYSFDLRRADGEEAGERVLSPATGVVSWVDRAYGGFALDLGDGYAVAVFHLDLAREIEVGRQLSAGQRIGNVAGPGGGGNGGTPHIHLTLWKTSDGGNDSRTSVPFDGNHPLEGTSFPAGRDKQFNQHLGAALVSSNRSDAPHDVPAAPVTLAPNDGAAFDRARDVPPFAWEPVLDADEYQVVLNDGERTGPWLPRTRWNPGDLAPGEWTWQVRARNDAGEGPLSAPRTLVISGSPTNADAGDEDATPEPDAGEPTPISSGNDSGKRNRDEAGRDDANPGDDAAEDDAARERERRKDTGKDKDRDAGAEERGADDGARDGSAANGNPGAAVPGVPGVPAATGGNPLAGTDASSRDRARPGGGTGRALDRADLLRDRAGVPAGPPATADGSGAARPSSVIVTNELGGATDGASDGNETATASGDGASGQGDGTASAADGDVSSGSGDASGDDAKKERRERRRARDEENASESAADGTNGDGAEASGDLQAFERAPGAPSGPGGALPAPAGAPAMAGGGPSVPIGASSIPGATTISPGDAAPAPATGGDGIAAAAIAAITGEAAPDAAPGVGTGNPDTGTAPVTVTGDASGAGSDPIRGENANADAFPAGEADAAAGEDAPADAAPAGRRNRDRDDDPAANAEPADDSGRSTDIESAPAPDADADADVDAATDADNGPAGTDGNISSGEDPPDLPRAVVNLLPNPGVYGIDPDARPNRERRREERRDAERENRDTEPEDERGADRNRDDGTATPGPGADSDANRDDARGRNRDTGAPAADAPAPAEGMPADTPAPSDPATEPEPETAPTPAETPPADPAQAPAGEDASPMPDADPSPEPEPQPADASPPASAPVVTPVPEPAPTGEPSATPRELVFLPIADASVKSATPDEPQPPAQASVLPIGSPDQATAYVTFAVEGVAPGTVVSAQLTVTGAIGFWGPVSIAVAPGYAVDEASLTWNTAPGRERPAAGADGNPAAIGALPNAEEVTVDVTGAVGGDGLVTFVLRGTPDVGQAIGSRESGIPARLTVTVGG